jgi:hypothetical protein
MHEIQERAPRKRTTFIEIPPTPTHKRFYRSLRGTPLGIAQLKNHETADPLQEAVQRAFVKQGARAFEMPRQHAAIHEAGHAVMFTAAGRTVSKCSIHSKWIANRKAWGGWTAYDGERWRVDEESPVEDDVWQIRFQMAGVLAEVAFLGADFREGSSLDEVLTAQMLAATIAVKTVRDRVQIFNENCWEASRILQANADLIQAIAWKLLHARSLSRKKLAPLLSDVRDGVAQNPVRNAGNL